MVKELIARGAGVDARSFVNNRDRQVTAEPRAVNRPAGGLTPLLFAAREVCLESARHLAEGGADLDQSIQSQHSCRAPNCQRLLDTAMKPLIQVLTSALRYMQYSVVRWKSG
jgi:hypothetical protein